MALLQVNNLSTYFHTREGIVKAVDGVDFSIDQGETLAIVGESGSGKSVACFSLLRLIQQPPGKIENGEAWFKGQDLLQLSEGELRKIRGNQIAIIFQDPMTSLNPFLTVGAQLAEPLIHHRQVDRASARQQAIQMLNEVGIHHPHLRIDQYPHEFSGGMRQRVMIAMALITEPDLLICDEPTTALDVTVQAQILELIRKLQQRRNVAVIFISHDLAVVAKIADRIAVMKQGKIVETGRANNLFLQPRHAYTRQLLSAIPQGTKPYSPTPQSHTLVEVANLSTQFRHHSHKNSITVVDNISLSICKGEILGLVGESGCGKSTLGRSILQLIQTTKGSVVFQGKRLTGLTPKQLRPYRRQMQMIFQDPYASLNPRMTVFDTLAEPLRHYGLADRNNVTAKVLKLMDNVGLPRNAIRKYPHEFSGGQRQRIAIGRAIATEPTFIVADEPVSALDVSIQSKILDLMLELAKSRDLTLLFISHDLSVVRHLCDRIAVMYRGKIIECNTTDVLYTAPQMAYTKELLSAAPMLKTAESMIANQ